MKNAIDLIKADLKRHRAEVTLPGEKKERVLFLIIIQALTKIKEDLLATYNFNNELSSLQLKLVGELFDEEETESEYGVFVDDNLKFVFAFNKKFADYNRQTKQLEYKDIDDFLISSLEINKKKTIKPLELFKPSFPSRVFQGEEAADED